jgi:hypothetical protein
MLIMEWQGLGDAATVYIHLPRRGLCTMSRFWAFLLDL